MVAIRVLACLIIISLCLLTTYFCRHAYVNVANAVDWKGSAYWGKFFFIPCLHIMPGVFGMAVSFRHSQSRFWLWSMPTTLVALKTSMLWYAPAAFVLQSSPPLSAELFLLGSDPFVFLNPFNYIRNVNLYNLRHSATFLFFALAFFDIWTLSRSPNRSIEASKVEPGDTID